MKPGLKLAILCQEEPVFLGPFLQGVIKKHPEHIAAVFIAGNRKAGEKQKTFKDKLIALFIYWLILEPTGFFHTLYLQTRIQLLKATDTNSVEYIANRYTIPVYHIQNPNSDSFHQQLRDVSPDLVLNQSELLLKNEVLSIPKIGFINRHASLLPKFRGRLASFWAHASTPASYGITIHFVDEEVDTGNIILQKEFPNIDSRLPYPQIMKSMMHDAPSLFWQAIDKIQEAGFEALSNQAEDAAYKFPTFEEALAYRKIMKARRLK